MNIDELVVKYSGWIRCKARWYYSNKDDADDLASETIYKCLSQGKRFDTERAFLPWAKTIMENTYITQYNRRRCVLFTEIGNVDTCLASDSAEQIAEVNRILEVIEDCGKKSCCIECVMLYAVGYSYDEIATIVRIPSGTVKSRVAAGRKMLRMALE